MEQEVVVGESNGCAPHPGEQATSRPPALEVKNVTVQYRAYKERPGTFKEHFLQFARTGRWPKYYSRFEALQNLSFTVEAGTSLGIIGSNGAGKSTLLKTLSGVIRPTKGEVLARGKVDSLISLGAGFDKELNAVENIYLYGSLHRIPKGEIEARVPRILEFAELEEFQEMPVRYFSSGMFARLGFSCALDMDPDILLVDEVLSVGDARFRQKSQEAMQNLLKSGRTIVVVSHGLRAMADLVDRIILLSKGRIVFDGAPDEAIKIYLSEDYEVALDGKRFVESTPSSGA
ncbi:ABC transporter ATP-binding protein [bacterium]|nr:ABC transporter ATP-binding protein [bacterium]